MKKWILIISTLILIILSAYFAYQKTSLFHNHFFKAQKLFNHKKYDESINLLTKIIRSDPEFLNSYRKLAEAWFFKNDLNAGVNYIENLIREDSTNFLLIHSLGYLYYKYNKYNDAGREYQKVLAHNPEYPSIYRDFIDNCIKLNFNDSIAGLLIRYSEKDTSNAFIYYGLGYFYITQYKWEAATHFLNKSLELNENIFDAYYLLGAIYYNTNQQKKFLEISSTGLEKSIAAGDQQYQCNFQGNVGLAYYSLINYDEAISHIKKAIKLSDKTGKAKEKMRNLGNLALCYRDMHDYENALKYDEKALVLSQQLKDRNSEGLWYRNMGSVYQMMGDYKLAFENYKKSLSIAIETGDKYTEWLALFGVALSEYNLGNYRNSLDYYNKTLKLAIETGNRWAECRCYNGIGSVYTKQSEYLRALEFNEKGLALANTTNDEACQSYCLENIAVIYNSLGDQIKTIECHKKALEVSRKTGDKDEIARQLTDIGSTYQLNGNYKAALKYYNESVKVLTEIDDKMELSRTYGNLGDLMIELKEYDKAKDYLDKALNISRELSSNSMLTYQLLNSGFLEYYRKNYKDSYKLFSDVLKYEVLMNVPELYWQAKYGQAMVLEKQSKPEKALDHYKSAINKIEAVQRLLPVEKYKSGFFENHITIYQDAIALLSSMQKQYPAENYDTLAFNYAERAKARAILENLVESRADVSHGIDDGLKQQEQQILKNIAEEQKMLYNATISDKKRKSIQSNLKAYEDSLEKVSREIKMKNTKYSHLFYPKSYTVNKLQRDILNPHEYILEFSLGNKQSHLWLISKDEFRFYELPENTVIEKTVKEYMHTIDQPVGLTNPFSNHISKGKDVFNLLLRKCTQEIDKGSHLIIVPDGILNYLPFESLITEEESNDESPHYLIEDYTLSYSPSSTSIAFFNKPNSPGTSQKYLLAFGDPYFRTSLDNLQSTAIRGKSSGSEINIDIENDAHTLYEEEGFDFTPLPYSGTEVSSISGLFPKSKCVTYLKKEASEEILKHENLEQYKYIHFATHGLIEENLPFRSGIVLSTNDSSNEDGILQVNEIMNLKLNADMVVLSACQTARGKLYKGEGIVGLARAFFYAGASSVAVCLWNINDRSSAGLMKDFYSGLVNGKDKKEALQQAKLDMIHSENKLYRHPYYWAPYVIVGNSN